MSQFKINLAANYISLAYTTAISLLFLPLFHQKLGAEFFGLVGIYALLTNVLSILDLGLVSTVSRECAIHRNNEQTSSNLIPIINGTEKIMITIAVIMLTVLVSMSKPIASEWINLTEINTNTAIVCFILIVASIIVRWLSGLYRGVLNGFEWQRATSGINALIVTLRFPCSYLLIGSTPSSAKVYFQLQLAISVVEYAAFYFLSKHVTSSIKKNTITKSEGKNLLSKLFGLSFSIASLTILTTLFTQIDKLVLSKTLSLGDFGDFSLITSLATGVATLGGPVAMALIPRLSNLSARRQMDELFQVYMQTLRLMLVVIVPAGLIVSFFGWQILYAWTGNTRLSNQMTYTFVFYVVGNCMWVFAALPGYLKYAKGDIKFLLAYNLFFLFLYLPTVAYVGIANGAKGVAFVWLVINALMLVTSHLLIHKEFFDASKIKIILTEMASSVVISSLILLVLSVVLTWNDSRLVMSLQIAAITLSIVMAIYVNIYRHTWRLSKDGMNKSAFDEK